MKSILKTITLSLSISIALTGIVSAALFLNGTFTLLALGNALLYMGAGITILGFTMINFRWTTVDIHMRHQGTPEEKRQKAQTDQADYQIGFSILLAGLLLSTSGWLMLN